MTAPILPGSPTVLLAEDDPILLELTTTLLREVGFQVHAFDNGAAALRRFREHPDGVDLAVLDVVMPGADGLAVRAELRERRGALPVILMSGTLPPLALSDSCHDVFLRKPFANDALQHIALQLVGAPDPVTGGTTDDAA